MPSNCTVPTWPSLKLKLDGHCDEYVPPATPGITINSKNKCKSREVHHSAVDEDYVVTGYEMAVRTEWSEHRYFPVEEWRRHACYLLGLTFV